MHEAKIAQYRAEAAICIARANSDSNKSTSTRWLKIATEWSRMADELEGKNLKTRPEIPGDSGN